MAFALQLKKYIIGNYSFSLLEPDKEVISASYRSGEISFPYWSQVWPAAIGLATFLVQHPQYVTGKKVLELAAGLGLPSLVAAEMGAKEVTVSDYALDAVDALQQTIAYHKLLNMKVRLLDWSALPNNLAAEVLLLSDISYDEKLFAIQENVIRHFLQGGTTVIISTPQRLIAKQAIQPLLPFCAHQEEITILHQQQTVAISLLVLQK